MFGEKEIREYNKKLEKIPFDELQEMAKDDLAKAKKDFEQLSSNLKKGICYYCKYPITHFSTKKPCLHWFLKPKGFKKKHFNILMKDRGFKQINTYLRWVANSENIAANINDLTEEQSSNSFIEETITYKNLEWSFSCSQNDRKGHEGTKSGSNPHYHFQMKVNGQVIINYSAFHLPFTDYDEFSFAVEAGKINNIVSTNTYSAGMQDIVDLFSEYYFENDILQYTEDESNAAFHTEIFIEAEHGKTISGVQIADLLEERKQTGQSFVKLAKKLQHVKVTSFSTPAEAVPDLAKRKGRKRKKL
jgi:hypothetical protein